METIKSYEDALKVLKREEPKDLYLRPKHEQAYHKLSTISDALNIGHSIEERIYYPWWWKNELISGVAARDSNNGLGNADWNFGSRLCSFDRDTAIYLGSEPFIKLWQEFYFGEN